MGCSGCLHPCKASLVDHMTKFAQQMFVMWACQEVKGQQVLDEALYGHLLP